MSDFKAAMDKWRAKGYRYMFSPYLFKSNPDKKCYLNPFSQDFDPTFYAVFMGLTAEQYAQRFPCSYERWIAKWHSHLVA